MLTNSEFLSVHDFYLEEIFGYMYSELPLIKTPEMWPPGPVCAKNFPKTSWSSMKSQ